MTAIKDGYIEVLKIFQNKLLTLFLKLSAKYDFNNVEKLSHLKPVLKLARRALETVWLVLRRILRGHFIKLLSS